MRKFDYPQELLEQVEFIAGKDSELYRACEQGVDIGAYISDWGNEFIFSNNEIINARNLEDLKQLRKQAQINLAKNEVFELYLDSYRKEVLNYKCDDSNNSRIKLNADLKTSSLIGRMVTSTVTQEKNVEVSPSSYKDDANESLAPTKREIQKSFEGFLDMNDIKDDDDTIIDNSKSYLDEEVKRKVEDFEPYFKAGLDS